MLTKKETLNLLQFSLQGLDEMPDDKNKEIVKETLESAIKLIKYPNSYINFQNNAIAFQNKEFVESLENGTLLLRIDVIEEKTGSLKIIPLTTSTFIDKDNGEDVILTEELCSFLSSLLSKIKYDKK